MWLNEHEIEHAADQHGDHPVLGPAAWTLQSLVEGANACSDGWCYWRKPANAASQLQTMITNASQSVYMTGELPSDKRLAAQLRKAYATLRQFRNHQPQCRFLIYPAPGVPGDEIPPPPPQPVALTVKVDDGGQPKFMIDSPDGLQPGRTYQGFVVEVSS